MKRIIRSEVFIVTALSVIILGLNAWVWVVKAANAPAGHEFIPIHNSLSDYPFYVSVIKQGLSGGHLVFDRFAVEPHEGSVLHLLYLSFGWAGALFGVTSAHLVYHITRFVLGAMWCTVIYWLCDTLIREKLVRIIAFFFALFSSSFPRFLWVDGALQVSWFMTWWSELDPVIRAAFVPHFTLGHIAMVTALISIFYYELKGDRKWLYRGALASFIAAFVHPPSFIQIAMVVPLYVLLLRREHWVIGSGIVLIAGFIGLWIINNSSNAFPWNQPKQFEGVSFAISVTEYLLALGPVVVLALYGAVKTIKKEATWLLLLWIITSIIMVPVSKTMPFSPITFIRDHPISNIRFLQVALWVPLGILGAIGLADIWHRRGRVAGSTMLVVFILFTFAGYPATMKNQIRQTYFSGEYTYPKQGYLKAIGALSTVTRPDQATLSLSLGGVTTPMYVDRTAYVGQVVYTPEREAKLKRSWEFFHGGMSACEAYTLLKSNNIGAVLYSFDEHNAGDAVKFYSFLQPWNTYGETTVYTVVDSPPAGC